MNDNMQDVRLHILSKGAQLISVERGSTVGDCLLKAGIEQSMWNKYTFTINNEEQQVSSCLPNSDTPILLVASPEIDGGY